MKWSMLFAGLAACASGALLHASAAAEPTLRLQIDQPGDFVLIGNTLGQECAAGPPETPAPVVGSVLSCGSGTGDSAPDVFWRADDPEDGQATADIDIAPEDARSTAVLQLPTDATVTHAFLYWTGFVDSTAADNDVRVERIGAFDMLVSAGRSTTVQDPYSFGGVGYYYLSVADVSYLVGVAGNGAYRVSDVDCVDVRNNSNEAPAVGWWLVVFFRRQGDPPRNLALFDGLDLVGLGVPQRAALSGFLVPNAGYDAKLGVVTIEGDSSWSGDALLFNDTPLSDALNPQDNFFNGTRSWLGSALSVQGDLPQLTGEPHSMSGLDMDVVDVTALVSTGDTSATFEATSGFDRFLLATFITSIATFKPDFRASNKTFVDVNGGALRPGDIIEYTIEAKNQGHDLSTYTVLNDALPQGVTYVPDSIVIVSGPNAGGKTDEAGDDQAEFDAGSRTIVVRLGTGADALQGGELAIDESSVVQFRVTVDASASGVISNQAVITAQGGLGAPAENYPTDGNGQEPGAPPTDSVIDRCETDEDCSGDKPLCHPGTTPRICVQCITSADCADPLMPDCDETIYRCVCAAGPDACAQVDAAVTDAGPVDAALVDAEHADAGDAAYDPTGEPCEGDSDCGSRASGWVCGPDSTCMAGCRGRYGNGCPEGQRCTSQDASIGECIDDTPPTGIDAAVDGAAADAAVDTGTDDGAAGTAGEGARGGAGGEGGQGGQAAAGATAGAAADAAVPPDGAAGAEAGAALGAYVEGGGCDCAVVGRRRPLLATWALLLATCILFAVRQRRQNRWCRRSQPRS